MFRAGGGVSGRRQYFGPAAVFRAGGEVLELPGSVSARRAVLQQRDTRGRTIAALELQSCGTPFAFSALPNTAQELEAAQHLCELPDTGRTSITVLGAVRGVGGIDSWGTDVEEACRLSGQADYTAKFRILLR